MIPVTHMITKQCVNISIYSLHTIADRSKQGKKSKQFSRYLACITTESQRKFVENRNNRAR